MAKVEEKDVSDVQSEIDQGGYDTVRERFEEYRENGRIAFTTFHQSYGYEEFIEGIKPIMESEIEDSSRTLEYEIKAGVFKQFCERAKAPVIQEQNHLGIRENPSIWKVSLKGSKLHHLKQDCFNNNSIRIGWDLYGEEPDDTTDYSSAGGKKVIAHFINEMQIGDIVLTLKNERTIDAVGIITGDYEWLTEESDYRRSRKVNWLLKDIDQDIYGMNGNTVMTLASVYRLHRITLEDVMSILEKHDKNSADAVQKNQEQFVFIIDEINRGNISKIFGELITLIEPSKRLGRPEAMKLRLPYSQSEFGVPDNVTILATMNTADRSIAQLDTALRRRFRFIELLPEPALLQSIDLESIRIDAMLAKMNERIEVLFDRDHVIGHAFFMPLRENPDMQKLADIFRHSIIPLLQEYFYDDWQMIQLVLGDHDKDPAHQFVQEITVDPAKLFGGSSIDIGERKIYRLQEAALLKPAAYKGIYE
ncbi:AAA family ATPase [Sporosarcina sp.]|uniref:AAA family ATPase n=1 Tax=Sporosarcina sp. TaxID=49982 RepID=UPI00260A32CC|nr:AAA family ATPase [Sporosarcina sp.]